MKNSFNPFWLIVVNTIPLAVLFFLLFGQFNIIESLLEEYNLNLWKTYGFTLGFLGLCNFLYSLFLMISKKKISFIYGAVALITYIPFLYFYSQDFENLIPRSVPLWMVSENLLIYVGTFLMPTLAYSLFVLVVHFTPKDRNINPLFNFLYTIAVPILGYIIFMVLFPLLKIVETNFSVHAMMILIITATLLFLFFLVRTIYILVTKKSEILEKYNLVWKIPIAIILPIAGLMLNNDSLFNDFSSKSGGVFGNFNSIWFFILALINGILVCVQNLKNTTYRTILFIGRAVTFSFTFYFFIVFLPFLPLSLVAVIAFGLGFLMLTPLMLFIIHISELVKDFNFLKNYISKPVIIGVLGFGILVIPSIITLDYLNDKKTLSETLSYLYSPDYSKEYDIDEVSLKKTIDEIKSHKERRFESLGLFSNKIPYLSSYFNWLVLDNLTLSDNKIQKIEKVFFKESETSLWSRRTNQNPTDDDIKISDVTTESVYDETQKVWKTWVNLELTNHQIRWQSEYSTVLDLPDGCWINNYYLFVEGQKEYGILAEKKAAMWIYSQIRSFRRDPGILYYLTGNKVQFKVFPFAKNEIRKTGIEFIHKEPLKINFDGNEIWLGDKNAKPLTEIHETENVIYVPSEVKKSLNEVKRKPYFHFLVDVSKGNRENIRDFSERIKRTTNLYPELSKNSKISFVGSYTKETITTNNWEEKLKNRVFEGGFFLERGIQQTLVNSYQDNQNNYPVIVIVTDSIQDAILERDFGDLQFTFPENNNFYNLKEDGKIGIHSLIKSPKIEWSETKNFPNEKTVLQYPISEKQTAFLPNDSLPNVILKNEFFDINENTISENNWECGLKMQGKWLSHILHPETHEKEWLDLVKYSFQSKIMNPMTSFLVVENEAQKKMLKKKQEEVLSGNRSLDLGEEPRRMSEPNLIVLISLILLFFWYRKNKKRKLSKAS